MLKWHDKYLTGISIVDEQHKELFDIINATSELLSLPSHTDKYDEIVHILDKLYNYTVFHFNTEQDIMNTIKYPKMFSHKVEHDDFISKIAQVDLQAIDENQDAYLLEIIDFAVDWIGSHIVSRDFEIVEYYNAFYNK